MPEVTPEELLQYRQDAWSQRFAAVSLVAEAIATPGIHGQALEVLAEAYRVPNAARRARLLRKWPAVQVMTTVGVAAEFYAGGNFWPQLSKRVRVQNGQQFQKEWGEAFLANLEELGLPDFDDIEGQRYLGPILMHSGVPTYCLRDYFRLATEQRRTVPGLEPERFVAWAAGRAVEGRLYNVDKPVERFVRYGGEYAIDVTDRVFELLDTVAAGGTGEDVPLPERFRTVALQMRNEKALERVPSRRDKADFDATEQPPHLRLDPYGRGPLLWLPPVDTSGGDLATWAVTIGSSTEHLRTQSLWPGEPAPEIEASIVAPVRSASVALVGYEQLRTAITVVDDNDPLLAFGEDGGLLPSGLPLRGSTVWLLYPGSADDLVVQGHLGVVAEGVLPPGWSGWNLQLVDLSQVTSVRSASSERSRRVRGVASVRISAGDPVPGVKSRTGAPVFPGPPQILLPGGFSDEAQWTVTVTDADGNTLLDKHNLHPGDDPRAIWGLMPRPLLGRYAIRVRGPWGRGGSREVFIAEGISAQASPPWRRINERGLVPATIQLFAREGLLLSAYSVALAESETEARVTAGVRGVDVALIVRPPHMSMSYQSAETSTPPGIRPVALHAEDLREAPGTLTLDLQEAAEPVLHVLDGSTEIQLLTPAGGVRCGIYRFDLQRISDTLATHPRLRLALDEGGLLAVANITPRKLFSGIELVDGGLRLENAPNVSGLVAIAYLARAPWREGVVLPVAGGEAVLPEELRGAGPLLVNVRIEDPWLPTPVPSWVTKGWVAVDQPGWYGGESDEGQLSRYLAGAGEFPGDSAELARIWSVSAQLPALALGDRFWDVADACSRVLRKNPAASMWALELSAIEHHRLPEVLVRSGLLASPTALTANRAHVTWTQAAALPTALLTGPRLVGLLGQESSELGEARLVCGDVVEDLLRGYDPDSVAGRFDQAADAYSHLDPATKDEFRRAAGLVPKGLLHKDSRVQAALELLERRVQASVWLKEKAGQSLTALLDLLQSSGDNVGQAVVRARMHPTSLHGWRTYPALSIGWAWVARRAARGGLQQRLWIETQRRLWTDLARIAPDLVAIDIIRSEILIAAQPTPAQEQL